eukprot:810862-Rhodomonas_salina.1
MRQMGIESVAARVRDISKSTQLRRTAHKQRTHATESCTAKSNHTPSLSRPVCSNMRFLVSDFARHTAHRSSVLGRFPLQQQQQHVGSATLDGRALIQRQNLGLVRYRPARFCHAFAGRGPHHGAVDSPALSDTPSWHWHRSWLCEHAVVSCQHMVCMHMECPGTDVGPACMECQGTDVASVLCVGRGRRVLMLVYTWCVWAGVGGLASTEQASDDDFVQVPSLLSLHPSLALSLVLTPSLSLLLSLSLCFLSHHTHPLVLQRSGSLSGSLTHSHAHTHAFARSLPPPSEPDPSPFDLA